nr:retrovirus-related Pol polyprotein from transposon TNT 1-94 [Tanacetum cinerariifolium]
MDLQDKGVIDSGCSRHMTGNMSYLIDYEQIDRGYVTFGGNPKERKITGKRTPTLSFMRPFGCPVTIINTKDHLGKFDGKADEGKGPNWLFNIDALTRTMNYEPIVAGTQSNGFAGKKASDNAGQARKETKPVRDYIMLPLWTADPPYSQDLKSSYDDGLKPSSNDEKKVDEDSRQKSKCKDQEKQDNVNSTNNVNSVSSTVNVAGTNELPFNLDMHALEDIGTFDFSNEDEDDDAVADMNNLDTTIQEGEGLKESLFEEWRDSRDVVKDVAGKLG